ncbi:MAG: glycosyltransferase family 2 protein, partial [Proteobacteria bacterium]|nr:glycosyltransferase family 2 protein [Pseudomonadota bacterium]
GLDIRNKIQVDAVDKLSPHLTGAESRNAILLNGNFNFSLDIQTLLQSIRPQISRHSRIFVICYNSYLRGPLRFASKIGLRTGPDVDTFLTRSDIHNLARLSGFEALSHRPVAHFPFRLFGIGTFLDRLLVALPLFKWLGVSTISVLRPIGPDERKLDLSILIPARNERGNIEPAVKRILELPIPVREVIFVEGHSSDETWNEIQRVSQHYRDLIKIKTIQQTGRGKADAVRIGFTLAEGDLLTILDADLTMPPEDLPKFYNAYKSGLADFVNGSRLVYPMEGEAMRFLNRLGNLFFARWISLLLNTHLNDTLCGTKFFARLDYLRFVQWRKDFGDFDPFGDFDLVFPAVVMNLGVIEVPIHYRARVYGSTQIRRFYHGAMLLKMCTIAFFKISIGQSDVSNKS